MAQGGNTYDAVPYDSLAYGQTHVAHLYTLGRLFGLDPPNFRRARVLELGCGGGGNIIPMADQYPEGRFIGIDLSSVQIGQAEALASEIGLKNVELRAQSILDFTGVGEPLDYVICHGTFSWVPREVQDKILEIVRAHLAPNGLAILSYNTLPGWSAVRGLRDMMRYHASFFATPAEQIAQSRALLRLIIDAQGERAGPYRAIVEGELALLGPERDSYVFHEYLEEYNEPFYLHEFISRAERAGLAYLCDSDPASEYLGTYEKSVAAKLAQIADPVRRGQYLDFISNRRFRSSVLMQKRTFESQLSPARLDEMWLRGEVRANDAENKVAKPGLVFTAPNYATFTAADRMTAAFFLSLAQGKRILTLDAIIAEAKERYGVAEPAQQLRSSIKPFVLRAYLSRGLSLLSDPGRHVTAVSERPAALPAARAAARRAAMVPNALHELIGLEPVTRAVIQLLDGTRDRTALRKSLAAMLDRGEVTIRRDGVPITDRADRELRLAGVLDRALAALAEEALLIG